MRRQWYAIAAVGLLIFLFNYILPSDLNNWATTLNFSLSPLLEDDFMRANTEWNYHNSEFGRRPFMVNVMRYGPRWTGLPSPVLFAVVQFAGYLVMLLAMYRLTVRAWPGVRQPPLVLLPFMLVFPNVFLFTAHAHTYDDLYQYLLLLTMLAAAVSQRPLLAITCATAACVVRETSLLFLPALAYLLWQHANWSALKVLAATGLAGSIAILLLWLYVSPDLAKETIAFTRAHRLSAWHANFSGYARSSETLVLTLVILAPFLIVTRSCWEAIRRQPIQRSLVCSALFLLVVNTAAVYTAALAREARLLLLPLLPLLPVVGPIVVRECRKGALQWRQYSATAWIVALVVALGITLAYRPSVGGTAYFYKAYVFCWVAAWSLLLYRLLERNRSRRQPA